LRKKNLGRNQARGSSPLANEQTVYDYDSGSIIGHKSYWIGTFRIFVQLSISLYLISVITLVLTLPLPLNPNHTTKHVPNLPVFYLNSSKHLCEPVLLMYLFFLQLILVHIYCVIQCLLCLLFLFNGKQLFGLWLVCPQIKSICIFFTLSLCLAQNAVARSLDTGAGCQIPSC